MWWIEILGFTGTGLLSITLIPQVIKTYKVKSASELSYVYLILQLISNIIFIIYSYYIQSMPILLCNSFVFVCSALLLAAKIKYRHNDNYERIHDSCH